MRCPSCGCEDVKVVDTRPTIQGNAIRRRRQCTNQKCGYLFTTYEIPADASQARKPLRYSPLTGSRYTHQDLLNRIFASCASAGMTLDDAAMLLKKAEGMTKDCTTKLTMAQADLCILKCLHSEMKYSYFVSYAVSRFIIDNPTQISTLWDVYTNLPIEEIYKMPDSAMAVKSVDEMGNNDFEFNVDPRLRIDEPADSNPSKS